jgi:DNA repair protein RadD
VPTLWPHQQSGFDGTLAAIAEGVRRILVTSPTGGGKSRIMGLLAAHYAAMNKKVILYSNRKLLVAQTSGVFDGLDITHGVRSAGHFPDADQAVQVSSIQTEDARVNKLKTWTLHPADLVLVDEAHLIKADVATGLFQQHLDAGAVIVGFTATPLDLEARYDRLVIAGRPSELRACGALVPATHYGCDEPDLDALKKAKRRSIPGEGEDFSETQARAAMCNPTLFARVGEWFTKLNPDHKPTLLFAPGVHESLWFAEKFLAKGITAAHLAANEVWLNGRWITGTTPAEEQEARQKVLDASKAGDCTVICNRFLLREGVDAPWLAHGIFATIFGSLQSYLQSGGRLLRAAPGKTLCTIQDHGGNWWRHGSLNADRHWDISYTAGMAFGLRAERMRDKKEREPWRCQGCGKVRTTACDCGHTPGPRKSRAVVTMEGDLKEMSGDVFKPRRVSDRPEGPQVWKRMYYRSMTEKGSRTFRAAMALFAQENYFAWPDKRWPYMPVREEDFFRLCRDVPRERLR